MDKLRVLDTISKCELNLDDLYYKVNVIDKEKTSFDDATYDEIVYLTMYLYHLKQGIHTLSKKGLIPDLIPRNVSYEQFRMELNKYKNLKYDNQVLPDITNMYQELMRLASYRLLDRGDWTRVLSSTINGNEVNDIGKLYFSIDNEFLYQFTCLMLTKCLKNKLYDYEFKANNNPDINRTDNMVIYFTEENLPVYLKIIEELKEQYPDFKINFSHMIGKEISEGVVIAKDYKDGSSFTDKVCKKIIELKKFGYDDEAIVDAIDDNIDKHLESVLSLIPDKETRHR